jgi:hypothetical protein
LTAGGGATVDFFDFEVDVALGVVVAAPDFVAPALGAVPLLAVPLLVVPLLAAPPLPAIVTTWAGGALALELLPERPISTPTPIASSSVPMPAINVLFAVSRLRGCGGGTAASRLCCATPSMNGNRGAPRRCPHSVQ